MPAISGRSPALSSSDFGSRFIRRHPALPLVHSEEVLIEDVRGHLTPAQMVENKLIRLMKTTSLPVSSLRSASHLNRR